MIFRARANSSQPVKTAEIEPVSVAVYLDSKGVDSDALDVTEPDDDPIEDFIDRHNLYEDTLKTVEGRKGAELKHRLTARMMVLYSLMAPMVVVPFWLMWLLSPGNVSNYEKEMQRAFLAALATNVLGLCWVVTRDLFPQGGPDMLMDSDTDDDQG